MALAEGVGGAIVFESDAARRRRRREEEQARREARRQWLQGERARSRALNREFREAPRSYTPLYPQGAPTRMFRQAEALREYSEQAQWQRRRQLHNEMIRQRRKALGIEDGGGGSPFAAAITGRTQAAGPGELAVDFSEGFEKAVQRTGTQWLEMAEGMPYGVYYAGQSAGLDLRDVVGGGLARAEERGGFLRAMTPNLRNRDLTPTRSRDLLWESAKALAEDFRHPLRNPGYLTADIALLGLGGAGTTARGISAAGRAGQAGRAAAIPREFVRGWREGNPQEFYSIERRVPPTVKEGEIVHPGGLVPIAHPLPRNPIAKALSRQRWQGIEKELQRIDEGGEPYQAPRTADALGRLGSVIDFLNVPAKLREGKLGAEAVFNRELRRMRSVDEDAAAAIMHELKGTVKPGSRSELPRGQQFAILLRGVFGDKALVDPEAAIAQVRQRHQDEIDKVNERLDEHPGRDLDDMGADEFEELSTSDPEGAARMLQSYREAQAKAEAEIETLEAKIADVEAARPELERLAGELPETTARAQAVFEVERARDEARAAYEADPENPAARAALAEAETSFGQLRRELDDFEEPGEETRLRKAARLTREVSRRREQMYVTRGLVAPASAEFRRAAPSALFRGEDLTEPVAVGISRGPLRGEGARRTRRDIETIDREIRAAEKRVARAEAKRRPRTRAEASERLAELEAEYDRFLDTIADQMLTGPERRSEQARRNIANARAGRTKKLGRETLYEQKVVRQGRKTVREELRGDALKLIRKAAAARPGDIVIKRFTTIEKEIAQLRKALGVARGERKLTKTERSIFEEEGPTRVTGVQPFKPQPAKPKPGRTSAEIQRELDALEKEAAAKPEAAGEVELRIPGAVYHEAFDPMTTDVPKESGWPTPERIKVGKGWQYRYRVTPEQAEEMLRHGREFGEGISFGVDDPRAGKRIVGWEKAERKRVEVQAERARTRLENQEAQQRLAAEREKPIDWQAAGRRRREQMGEPGGEAAREFKEEVAAAAGAPPKKPRNVFGGVEKVEGGFRAYVREQGGGRIAEGPVRKRQYEARGDAERLVEESRAPEAAVRAKPEIPVGPLSEAQRLETRAKAIEHEVENVAAKIKQLDEQINPRRTNDRASAYLAILPPKSRRTRAYKQRGRESARARAERYVREQKSQLAQLRHEIEAARRAEPEAAAELPKGVRQTISSDDPTANLGNAGHVENGVIHAVHVTDEPSHVVKSLEAGRPLTREGGLEGDLGVTGLYVSDAPQLWKARARDKWSFIREHEFTSEQRFALVKKLTDEVDRMLATRYITKSEHEGAMRGIEYFRDGGHGDALVNLAGQPYNLDWSTPAFLKPLGIPPSTKQPQHVPVELRGRFAELERERPPAGTIEALKAQGYDGVFTRGGMAGMPQLVVWNNEAVVRFGSYQRAAAKAKPAPAAVPGRGKAKIGTDAYKFEHAMAELSRAKDERVPKGWWTAAIREAKKRGDAHAERVLTLGRQGKGVEARALIREGRAAAKPSPELTARIEAKRAELKAAQKREAAEKEIREPLPPEAAKPLPGEPPEVSAKQRTIEDAERQEAARKRREEQKELGTVKAKVPISAPAQLRGFREARERLVEQHERLSAAPSLPGRKGGAERQEIKTVYADRRRTLEAPVGSYYTDLRAFENLRKGEPTAKFAGLAAESATGRGPISKGRYDPTVTHDYTGETIRAGNYRVDVANATVDGFHTAVRLTSALDMYAKAWGISSPTKRSDYDVPIRAPSKLPRKLQAAFAKGDAATPLSADELKALERVVAEQRLPSTYMAALERHLMAIEHDGAPVGTNLTKQGVRWIDRRFLADLATFDKSVPYVDAVNNFGRLFYVYGRVAYILNLPGNLGMQFITQGIAAPRNYKRALALRKTYDEETAAIIENGVGEGKARAYSVPTGALAKQTHWLANFWTQFIDRHSRVSSFLNQMRKEGIDLDDKEAVARFVKTPSRQRAVAFRRANKDMVEFNNLSAFERNTLRHWIFIYPWMSRATVWALRTMVEHPYKTFTMAQLSRIAAEKMDAQVGQLPSYLAQRGYFPVGGIEDGKIKLVNPSSISTFSTGTENARLAATLLWKGVGERQPREAVSPAVDLLLGVLTGETARGRTYEEGGLVGSVKELLKSTPEYQAARRAGLVEKQKGELPLHQQPVFQEFGSAFEAIAPFVAGGLTPRKATLEVAHERARLERLEGMPPVQRAGARIRDEFAGLVKEARRVGVLTTAPPRELTEALNERVRYETAYAKEAKDQGIPSNRLSSIDRTIIDLDLLVILKRITRGQASAALAEARKMDENQIRQFRRDMHAFAFRQEAWYGFRSMIAQAGGDL